MSTQIKFCGMTRAEDVDHAIDLEVNALGFVFVKESPRNLGIEQARQLMEHVPPFIMRVGLFMDATVDEIEDIIRHTRLNMLQFHGSEEEEFCCQFPMPYLKAVPVHSTDSIERFCTGYPSASGFVLDSHASGKMGGTGESFAWNRVPASLDRPVVLAGGLTPENIARAVREVQPYAVDVSTGIESSPGLKDFEKMKRFVMEARHGQQSP